MASAKKVKKVISVNLDKERHLKFNLNTFIIVEELTGKKLADLQGDNGGFDFKYLRALLYAGLKHEDKELTLEDVGELIDMDNMETVTSKLEEAMGGLK